MKFELPENYSEELNAIKSAQSELKSKFTDALNELLPVGYTFEVNQHMLSVYKTPVKAKAEYPFYLPASERCIEKYKSGSIEIKDNTTTDEFFHLFGIIQLIKAVDFFAMGEFKVEK